jgi:thiol-disulfide isomerase/thioredoxin
LFPSGNNAAAGNTMSSSPPSTRELERFRGLVDLEGRPTTLAPLLGQSITVVAMIGTWCPDCKRDLPVLSTVSGRYGQQGVRVVGVALDEEPAAVKTFVSTAAAGCSVVIGDARMGQRLHITTVPTTLFLNSAGREIDRFVGPMNETQLSDRLQRLMPALTSQSEQRRTGV